MSCDIPSNIALITGPYVLGGLFSYGLLGALAVQIFYYQYTFYRRDPLWLILFVYVLALLDLVITIMWTVFMWEVLAQHWGDPSILANVKTAATIPLLSGIVASMAHFFYAWRIYRLTKSLIIPIPIALLSLTTCAMAGYSGIRGAQIGTSGEQIRFAEMDPEVSTWLGGSTLCDFLITAVLVSQLSCYGKRSSSPQTRDVLLRLITVTVETGLITSLTALAELLLFLSFRDNTLYYIALFILSKVYSNCLLATLNTRSVINPETGAGNNHPLWVDLDQFGRLAQESYTVKPRSPPRVYVGTSVCHDRDVELVILPDSKEDGINITPRALKTTGIGGTRNDSHSANNRDSVVYPDLSSNGHSLKS